MTDQTLRAGIAEVRSPKRGRMTVSIPAHLAAWVRDVAQRNDVPMSAVVELALKRARRANGE